MTTKRIRKLADNARLRLVIDGIALQTTAGMLRHGGLSTCLWDAFKAFEVEYNAGECIGRTAGFHDHFLNRNINIQIDAY